MRVSEDLIVMECVPREMTNTIRKTRSIRRHARQNSTRWLKETESIETESICINLGKTTYQGLILECTPTFKIVKFP